MEDRIFLTLCTLTLSPSPPAPSPADQVSVLEDAFEEVPLANTLLLSWLFKHLSHLADKVSSCASLFIIKRESEYCNSYKESSWVNGESGF